MKIFTESETCEIDGTLQRPIIIPPTWQKGYSNPYLNNIWLQAEQFLRKCEKILFLGYSLPDSDINIKYLLKKSLYRDDKSKVKIYVITNKDKDTIRRYQRLFGQIHPYEKGFKKFLDEFKYLDWFK